MIRKTATTVIFGLLLLTLSGCSLLESLLSDVGGLNLSACGKSPSICAELYFDNIDLINGVDEGEDEE